MATRVCVLDGGGPTDSENTLNSFLTKCGENVFWQIGTEMQTRYWKVPNGYYPCLWALYHVENWWNINVDKWKLELAYLLDRSSPCSHSFLSPAFVLLWAIKNQPDSRHGLSPYQTHWKNYKENVSKWKELGSSLERLRQVNLHKHQDHINMSSFYQRYGHHQNFPCSLFLKSTLASFRSDLLFSNYAGRAEPPRTFYLKNDESK